MSEPSTLKIPKWFQAVVLVMLFSCVPPIALILNMILRHMPTFNPVPFLLLFWYLFLIVLQYKATFSGSPRAAQGSMFTVGITGVLHAIYFNAVLFYSGFAFAMSDIQLILTFASFIYLPASALLFFSMIRFNYVWLRQLSSVYGPEGPSEKPRLVTLKSLFGAIAFIAMVMGILAAIEPM